MAHGEDVGGGSAGGQGRRRRPWHEHVELDSTAAGGPAGGSGAVSIHLDTLAALAALALALQRHPDDAAALNDYGGTLPAAVADAVDELIE